MVTKFSYLYFPPPNWEKPFKTNAFLVLLSAPTKRLVTVLQSFRCEESEVAGVLDQLLNQQAMDHLGLGSPYSPCLGSPCEWLIEQRRGNNRGLNLIRLLRECAHYVACGSINNTEMGLDFISQLASPDGDSVQRVATYFSKALGYRIVKYLPGVCRALSSSETSSISEESSVHNYFFKLCPFLKIAYLVTNQAIVEAMEGKKWSTSLIFILLNLLSGLIS